MGCGTTETTVDQSDLIPFTRVPCLKHRHIHTLAYRQILTLKQLTLLQVHILPQYYHPLNLNSLPVKCQNDNPSPGAVVPGSHKRSKLRHTIIRQFSRGNQRIREVIPIPDSSGKEPISIGVFTSRGYLKGHKVLISAGPNLGNKVICRYSLLTIQTFIYNKIIILSFPLF